LGAATAYTDAASASRRVIAWPTETEVEVWLGVASVALVVWFFWSVRRK
jgi:hypothetical protein